MDGDKMDSRVDTSGHQLAELVKSYAELLAQQIQDQGENQVTDDQREAIRIQIMTGLTVEIARSLAGQLCEPHTEENLMVTVLVDTPVDRLIMELSERIAEIIDRFGSTPLPTDDRLMLMASIREGILRQVAQAFLDNCMPEL
jgi:hypothetical protein